MFHSSITEAEIAAVRRRLNEGMYDEAGRPLWNETAEEWYARNVALVGEEIATSRFKEKAAVIMPQRVP